MRCSCSIALVFLLFATGVKGELREGLVAYWPFEKVVTRGWTTTEVVGGHHLAFNHLSRTTNWVEGRFGKAFLFNGDPQCFLLHYAKQKGLPISTNTNFTVALWVKGAPNQTNVFFLSEGSSSNTANFAMGTALQGGPGLHAFVSASGIPTVNISTEAPVFDDLWHHVAWVTEESTVKVYIDGTLDGSTTMKRGKSDLGTLCVGALVRRGRSNFFHGTVDEMAFWSRALSAKEIQDVQNDGLAVFFPR